MPEGLLRYPYEAITEKTDFLQLTIFNYDTSINNDGNLTSQNFQNENPYSSLTIAQNVNKAKVLGPGGVIALPMPSNIQDSNAVSYEAGNMNQLAVEGLDIAQGLIGANIFDLKNTTTALKEFSEKVIGQRDNKGNLDGTPGLIRGDTVELVKKSLAAQAVNVFGANVSLDSLLARSEGKILNPNMELLFNNVTLRTFRFSFKMTPRDDREATSIKSIIRSLKKNMAAKTVTGDNLFLKTPNIFELQYKKGNKPHPFLNLFKPCALSDMSVNYTGENVYATYADGTPLSMVMTLTFKELLPIYEDDYVNFPNFNGNPQTDSNGNSEVGDSDLEYNTTGTAPNKQQANNVQGVGY